MLTRVSSDTHVQSHIDLGELSAANPGAPLTVGRSTKCTINLPQMRTMQALVSTKHAELRLLPDGRLQVLDLQSTNGTYYTRPGDEATLIRLGKQPVQLDSGSTLYIGSKRHVSPLDPNEPLLNPYVFLYTARRQRPGSDKQHMPPPALRQLQQHRQHDADFEGQPEAKRARVEPVVHSRQATTAAMVAAANHSCSSGEHQPAEASAAVSLQHLAAVPTCQQLSSLQQQASDTARVGAASAMPVSAAAQPPASSATADTPAVVTAPAPATMGRPAVDYNQLNVIEETQLGAWAVEPVEQHSQPSQDGAMEEQHSQPSQDAAAEELLQHQTGVGQQPNEEMCGPFGDCRVSMVAAVAGGAFEASGSRVAAAIAVHGNEAAPIALTAAAPAAVLDWGQQAGPSQGHGAAAGDDATRAAANACFTCAICRGLPVAPHQLGCSHMFCGPCLAQWLDNKRQCPTCRRAVEAPPMFCKMVEDFLTEGRLASSSEEQELEDRRKQWQEHKAATVQKWQRMFQPKRSMPAGPAPPRATPGAGLLQGLQQQPQALVRREVAGSSVWMPVRHAGAASHRRGSSSSSSSRAGGRVASTGAPAAAQGSGRSAPRAGAGRQQGISNWTIPSHAFER